MTGRWLACASSSPVAVALLAAASVAWWGLTGFAWSDYDNEAAGSLAALTHGHLGGFFSSAPAYGGSLLMRAPFALMTAFLGGGETAVYRMMALPCLLAVVGLGVVLFKLRTDRLPRARWSLLVVVLAAGNPVFLRALDVGHPEELLGAALCGTASRSPRRSPVRRPTPSSSRRGTSCGCATPRGPGRSRGQPASA